jgi:hypothetical protein
MNLTFSPEAWEDYLYWHKTDARIVERIHLSFRAGIGRGGLRPSIASSIGW